jgi:hypothetical protein
MEQRCNYPQIFDGFCYGQIFGTRPFQGCNWYWNCLENLLPLRLAADDYRPRTWVAPKEFFNIDNPNRCNILPGKTEFFQIQVKPRSYLWGLNFAVFDQDTLDSIGQTRFSIMIKETGTEIPLFDRPIAGSGIQFGLSSDLFNELKPQVELLPMPRLILEPGLLDISISNDCDPATTEESEGAVSCQLAMFFAEPK